MRPRILISNIRLYLLNASGNGVVDLLLLEVKLKLAGNSLATNQCIEERCSRRKRLWFNYPAAERFLLFLKGIRHCQSCAPCEIIRKEVCFTGTIALSRHWRWTRFLSRNFAQWSCRRTFQQPNSLKSLQIDKSDTSYKTQQYMQLNTRVFSCFLYKLWLKLWYAIKGQELRQKASSSIVRYYITTC